MIGKIALLVALLWGLYAAVVGGVTAQEPEMMIVKYGKVTVKSPVPDAKVYVDDVYKGRADKDIENITVGEHVISCRAENQSVTGTFVIKKDETLTLEARFSEKRLVAVVEHESAEKAAVEKKPKPEKPKKPVVEVKKQERKSPEEERRELYLSVIKVYFENADAQDVRITHKLNLKVISKFAEKKSRMGSYYRTKRDILLCDTGPCEQQWSASFAYTDESGKSDSIGLTWKQTVFNGITPQGTSKRDLLYCLNGACMSLEDALAADKPLVAEAGRYHITLTKSSLVIQRSDIMKEIIDAGGSVEAY